MKDLGKSYTLQEVLTRFKDGPQSGIFTDGSARPNPGPGGWGVVCVENGAVQAELHGHEKQTTNNQMELRALIEAYKLAKDSTPVDVYSDSELCVKTINTWALAWEKAGWKRKSGPIANLELVKELYSLQKAKKNIHLQWIKAHNGWLWNEYVDSLASAWTREEL